MKIPTLSLLALLSLSAIAHGQGRIIIIPEPRPAPPVERPVPLELREHKVEVEIRGQLAETSVEQSFYNPSGARLQGDYLFPLPAGAQIERFSMDIDGEDIEAELLDEDKARTIYEDIVRRDKDPALMQYIGRGLVRVRVFPIEPRSEKKIRLRYSELLGKDSGMVTYRTGMGEGNSGHPMKAGQASVSVRVQAEGRLGTIYSPSHEVEVVRDGRRRARVGWEAKAVVPGRDFVLHFSEAAGDLDIQVMSHVERGEDGYFLLLASPLFGGDGEPAPKDVCFVLDSSGSMRGEKLEQAKEALGYCVESLNEGDRFEIIRFSTDVEPLFGKLVDAGKEQKKEAEEFLGGLRAVGGTAIGDALDAALATRPGGRRGGGDGGRPHVVIFLTDGLPTVGERDIDKLAEKVEGKGGGSTRVFSFGIGADVNTDLLDRIAEATRAFSNYVLEDEDLEIKLSSFFTKIAEPAMTGLELGVEGGDVRLRQLAPRELPDLFVGDQLVLAGRYRGAGDVRIELSGEVGGERKTFSSEVSFPRRGEDRPFVARLWATRQVGYLLDEIRRGGETKEVKEEVVRLARKYGIVTPYTAYLILEDEERRNVPMAQRSLRSLEEAAGARDAAEAAWGRFRSGRSGDEAVGNALAQNALKLAESPDAAQELSRSEAAFGLSRAGALSGGGGGPVLPGRGHGEVEGLDRVVGVVGDTQFVGGRNFVRNGAQWVDSGAQAVVGEVRRVAFGSEEYYQLAAEHPEARDWLAMGTELMLVLGDEVVEVFVN
jgi:Ca-activated chloride channel homolog